MQDSCPEPVSLTVAFSLNTVLRVDASMGIIQYSLLSYHLQPAKGRHSLLCLNRDILQRALRGNGR